MNSDPEETKNPTTPTGSRSILHRVVNAINQYFPQERDNKGWQDPSNPLLHGWRYVARDPVLTSEQRDHARIQEALEAEENLIHQEQERLVYRKRPGPYFAGAIAGFGTGSLSMFRYKASRCVWAALLVHIVGIGVASLNYHVVKQDPAYKRAFVSDPRTGEQWRMVLYCTDLDFRKVAGPLRDIHAFAVGASFGFAFAWLKHIPVRHSFQTIGT